MAATVITTITDDESVGARQDLALLRLLQLVSPSFPVGAFAYSQGLEGAIQNGWVSDDVTTQQWMLGLLEHGLGSLEVPIIHRAMEAWSSGDHNEALKLSELQLACREARELQEEDLQLGRAMLRALKSLGVDRVPDLSCEITYAVAFSLAACQFQVGMTMACQGFLYAWCDNQAIAASRLIPLGQNQAQQVLAACLARVPSIVRNGLALTDDQIGMTSPGLAIVAAQHETQYARLFRS